MGKISINGAVFIFMARGEKLKDSDVLSSNALPDQKYVLWPRGEGWDVRYLVYGAKGIEWLPIAEHLFADEPEAWQAAYGHWMEIYKRWDNMLGISGAVKRHNPFDFCDTFETLKA
ncbi:TPA: hypothetical protein LTW89_004314 [Enterobacter hormaechei]|uniref:hypothetical protein n=1 Tax=Enterobacter cloacae complex TaxID=354276 RepID=UPI001F4B08F7|nr:MULTISPECIES: hypothetical protein [Enterobacter cloacae complex]MCU2766175.1 hypothetical protein [Enterobacter hormaechei subsp. steigerwaltii]HBL4907322.1 hypothetical protein [Enterobacter hormaechei]ELC7393266.1 hypothetical protein [Enterobacter asburiae]MCW4741631.1 hypothetical protein [Enterobacter hormaechei subsp. hoffmannii]HBL6015756.1 hypothetical protein [Enterobacter hormaechei]